VRGQRPNESGHVGKLRVYPTGARFLQSPTHDDAASFGSWRSTATPWSLCILANIIMPLPRSSASDCLARAAGDLPRHIDVDDLGNPVVERDIVRHQASGRCLQIGHGGRRFLRKVLARAAPKLPWRHCPDRRPAVLAGGGPPLVPACRCLKRSGCPFSSFSNCAPAPHARSPSPHERPTFAVPGRLR
jgi:hypothetical protein